MLIFHNNPLNLRGSKTVEERNILIDKCEKLIFVSNWVKEKFFEGLNGKNNKVVYLPYEATGVLSSIGGIKDMLSGVGKK